jgi:hypothetical protein
MRTAWFVCAATAGVVVAVSAQSPTLLSSLTVPASSLPVGCELKPPDKVLPVRASLEQRLEVRQLRANPWTGTDRALKLAVRETIEGPEPLPDAPPVTRREIALRDARLADEIAEAYRAEYNNATGAAIYVSAIRFRDPQLAKPALFPGSTTRAGITSTRIVRDDTVIQLSGAGDCFSAIKAFLAAGK